MVAMANPSVRRAPEPIAAVQPASSVVIYPSKKAARKKKRDRGFQDNGNKSQAAVNRVPPIVVLDPAPTLAKAVSIKGECDCCGKRTNSRGVTMHPTSFDDDGKPLAWATSTREVAREVDGEIITEIIPDQFRVFLSEIHIFPVATKIVERGRTCWDIWPISAAARRKERADMPVEKLLAIPLNVSRWLCPDCWREIEEIGVNQWLWEELDAETRENAEDYAARVEDEEPLEEEDRQPSYAEDFQDRAMAAGVKPKFMGLEPEDLESIRREVESACEAKGLIAPPMPRLPGTSII